ncbi:MAG TPA: TldD/PmbA family protein, partial [Dehalococcoidia bacterium]|nr:TldD/PmbA family protein [Dehalococcoidia bacterium]
VSTEETPVQFEANRLKQMNARQISGAALRVIVDGRIGFASSTRPQEAGDLVEAALETAPFGPEAKFDFPSRQDYPPVEVYDPAVEQVSVEHMVHLGQALIDAVRRYEPELQCDGGVRKATSQVTCLNSSGGNFSYRGSVFSLSVHGTLVRGTDMLFVGDGDASCQPIEDFSAIERHVAEQLEHSRKIAAIPTGEMPVIFTPDGVASALAMPLSLAFSGRLVYQAQSPLVGCLGKRMYDPRLSVIDDATLPFRPASRICDDEGVPSRRLPLIENGVVQRFLYDLQTAGLAGTQSTGHGERSLASQPSISTSSLLVQDGDTAFADMLAGVKEGLVVEWLMGAGQGNVLGGDFSGNVLLGYKIENGQIVGRVKDTVVSGNAHQALKEVSAIGNDGRWVSASLYTPSLFCPELSVSSK